MYSPYTKEGGIGNIPLPLPDELRHGEFPILDETLGYIPPSERRKFNALLTATTAASDGIRPVNVILQQYQDLCRGLAHRILRKNGFNKVETEFAPPNSITYATLRTLTGELELIMVDRFGNNVKNVYTHI